MTPTDSEIDEWHAKVITDQNASLKPCKRCGFHAMLDKEGLCLGCMECEEPMTEHELLCDAECFLSDLEKLIKDIEVFDKNWHKLTGRYALFGHQNMEGLLREMVRHARREVIELECKRSFPGLKIHSQQLALKAEGTPLFKLAQAIHDLLEPTASEGAWKQALEKAMPAYVGRDGAKLTFGVWLWRTSYSWEDGRTKDVHGSEIVNAIEKVIAKVVEGYDPAQNTGGTLLAAIDSPTKKHDTRWRKVPHVLGCKNGKFEVWLESEELAEKVVEAFTESCK